MARAVATFATSLIKPYCPPSNVRVLHKTSRCSKKTSHSRKKGPNGTAHLETHLSHAMDSPESLHARVQHQCRPQPDRLDYIWSAGNSSDPGYGCTGTYL